MSHSLGDKDSIDFHCDKFDLERGPLAVASVGPPGPLAPFLTGSDLRNIWYFGLWRAFGVVGSSSDSGLLGPFSWSNWNYKGEMNHSRCIIVYLGHPGRELVRTYNERTYRLVQAWTKRTDSRSMHSQHVNKGMKEALLNCGQVRIKQAN